MIAESGWPESPRALFNICASGASCREGYFRSIGGSNSFSMSRSLFDVVGGYDERFLSPGGGLANREIFERYVCRPNAVNICILAEGTFHQVHGGAATSRIHPPEYFRDEYRKIFGKEYRRLNYKSLYYAPGGKEFVQFVSVPSKKRPKPTPSFAARVRSRLRRLIRV
jgi:hypothetical protein